MYIAIKTESFAKMFFLISLTGLVMYAILAFYTFHTAYTTVSDYEAYHTNGLPTPSNAVDGSTKPRFYNETRYILIWTIPMYTVNPLGEGQELFVKYNCAYTNCYLTTQAYILNNDYRNFDAMLMDVNVVRKFRNVTVPHYRYPRQKFIFYGMKSANDTPICLVNTDKYFNWTWTYKLTSDIVTPFIEVTDLEGNIVAPKVEVQWLQNLTDTSGSVILKLETKKKAVAWIMDTCKERLDRMVFVKDLKDALNEHSLELDVFAHERCQHHMCPNGDCLKMVRKDYYYYLAYEKSHAEDYVTEEVLKAYDNYAVPIVKGGADYTRFLPEGSYLDSSKSSVKQLAAIVAYSIRYPEVYYNFHRWRNHYVIRKVDIKRGVCDLCENLVNESKFGAYSSYESFRTWWYNGPLVDRCYPKGSESMVDIFSYLNATRKRSSHKD